MSGLKPLASPQKTEIASSRGRTILVVDDDDFMRYAISFRLREEGFHVVSATDGGQAIELVNAKGHKPDLILLDLMMPYVSGFEFIQLIRDKYPSNEPIPIIIVSSLKKEELVEGGYKLEGYHFLEKPLALDELIHWVNHFLSFREN